MKQKILSARKVALIVVALLFALLSGAFATLGMAHLGVFAANTGDYLIDDSDPSNKTVTLYKASHFSISGNTLTNIKTSFSDPYNSAVKGRNIIVDLSSEEFDNITEINTQAFYDWGSNPSSSLYRPIIEVKLPKNLKTIGDRAFYSCDKITSIALPDGLTTIGSNAFEGCNALTEITLPASVTNSNNAFRNCKNLKTVTIEEGATALSGSTFYGCTALTDVTLPSTLTTIGSQAFYGCSSLASIELPEGLTTIESRVFYNCTAMTSIELPDGLTEIGAEAFAGTEIPELYHHDTLYYIADKTITEYTVRAGTTKIAERAFNGFAKLTEVELPDTVSELGERVFYGCTVLSTVNLPEGITAVPANAFQNCKGLTSIELPSTVTTIGSYAFSGCSKLASVEIPDGLTAIGDGGFYNCAALTKLDLPASVTTVGEQIFNGTGITDGVYLGTELIYAGANSITAFEVREGTTKIGDSVFQNYAALASVTLPASITELGENAFYQTTALTSVELPAGLQTIGRNAFYGSGLTGVTIPVSVTDIGYGAFKETSSLASLTVNGKASVGEQAFYRCRALAEINFGTDGCFTSIGNQAFYEAGAGIERLTLPAGLTTVGASAFNSANIASFKLESVTEIGSGAFAGSALTSIEFPSTLTELEKGAIGGASNLKEIILHGGLRELYQQSWKTSGRDNSLTVKVDSIGDWAQINLVNYGTGTSSGYYSTYTYNVLVKNGDGYEPLGENVVIPDGTDRIGDYAFYGMGVKSVTIPDSVKSIGAYAFAENDKNIKTNLRTVLLNKGSLLESIGASAFRNSYLQEFLIPAGVAEIADNAFLGCESMVAVYNLSDLALEIGSETNGRVAEYASAIFTEYNGSLLHTDEKGFIFLDAEVPALVGYAGEGGPLDLPALYNGKQYAIAANAFEGVESITAVTIPSVSVLTIGRQAFKGCVNLKTLTVGSGVTGFGANAFENCTALTTVNIDGGNGEVEEACFKGCTALSDLNFTNAHIEKIGKEAFMNCTTLNAIAIPATVTEIGGYAYANCSAAVKFSIAKDEKGNYNLTTIGAFAFAGTASLESAFIPDSVTTFIPMPYIGGSERSDYLFQESGIRSVEIGGKMEKLEYTFKDCANLSSVTWTKTANDSLKTLYRTFSGCRALKTVTIPSNIEVFYDTFEGVDQLESITIPASVIPESINWKDRNNYNVFGNSLAGHTVDFEHPELSAVSAITIFMPSRSEFPDWTDEEYGQRIAEFIALMDDTGINAWTGQPHYSNEEGRDWTDDDYNYGSSILKDEFRDYFFYNSLFYMNSAAVVFGDQASYNAVYNAMTNEWYNRKSGFESAAEEEDWTYNVFNHPETKKQFPLNAVRSKLYYEVEVTYAIYGPNGEYLDRVTEIKLARNEITEVNDKRTLSKDKVVDHAYPAADIRYVRKVDENGVVRYVIDENYTFPTAVGAYATADGEWSLNSATLDSFDGIYLSAPITFRNDLSVLKISIAEEYTGVYNGAAWTLPTEFDGVAKITAINGNSASLDAINAGSYDVTVETEDGYTFADGTTKKVVKLTIERAKAEITWTLDDGTTVAANEIPEITYSDASGWNLFDTLNVKFKGVSGDVKIESSQALRYLNGETSTESPNSVGIWMFEVIESQFGNYELSHAVQQFRIVPKSIELSTAVAGMQWSLAGENGVLLRDADVYVYQNGANRYYYTQRQTDASLTFVEVVNAKNAVARYRNAPLSIAIADAGSYGFDIAATSNVAQTGAGSYTATFTFTANSNYVFTLNQNVALSGVQVALNGNTATVIKTWFIVTEANDFVAAGGNDYAIAGWTYGASVSGVGVPKLINGDVTTYGGDDDKVTLTLTLNGQPVDKSFKRDRFDYYINDSMPAGTYVLRATAAAFNAKNGVFYDGFYRDFTFTVAKANVTLDLTKGENGYADYAWRYDSENKGAFFDGFVGTDGALKAANVGLTQVAGKGYWSASADSYTVTYNFARIGTNDYAEAKDMGGYIKNDAAARADGFTATYTVYFDISAENHNSLTATGTSRYNYFFTVTVYEAIKAPTVDDGGLTYSGNRVLPEITDGDGYDNSVYEVVWNSDPAAYVNGGTHYVSFRLNDSTHYRWLDSTGAEVGKDTVEVSFTIDKAQNSWTRDPNIVNWTFETFDTEVNRIYAVAKFLDAGKNITFTITKADGSAIDGLGAFTMKNDGTTDNADLIAAFNGLVAGAYKLKVSVEETGNYYALPAELDFNIGKSINTWADGEDDLVLPSWIVGRYNEEENILTVNAAHGLVNIIVTDLDGNEYYNSTTGVNNLNDCPVGKYLVKAWVEETDNFAALAERTFTIEVLEKAGLPWWAVTLIVIGSLGVAALILWILHEKGVLQMLTGKIVIAMRTKMTVDATIAAVRANKRAEESKKSVARAEALDRLEAARKAREEKANMSPEERAAALAEKAATDAAKAEKLQKRANRLQKRADRLVKNSGADSATETEETVEDGEIPEETVTAENGETVESVENAETVETAAEEAVGESAEPAEAAEETAEEVTAETAESADEESASAQANEVADEAVVTEEGETPKDDTDEN